MHKDGPNRKYYGDFLYFPMLYNYVTLHVTAILLCLLCHCPNPSLSSCSMFYIIIVVHDIVSYMYIHCSNCFCNQKEHLAIGWVGIYMYIIWS